MTAKEFKRKYGWRKCDNRRCDNCRHERVKLWQDGLETRVATGCAANGEGKHTFMTQGWCVCDAWEPERETKHEYES